MLEYRRVGLSGRNQAPSRVSGVTSGGASTFTSSRFNFSSICIFMVVVTSAWSGVKPFGVNLADLLLVFATVVVLFSGISGNRSLRLFPWMVLPALVAFVVLAAQVLLLGGSLSAKVENTLAYQSASITNDDGGGLLFLSRLILSTTLIAFLALSEVETHGWTRGELLLKLAAGGTILSAVVALSDDLGVSSIRSFTYNVLGERQVGLAFHPNSFAQSLVIALPLVVYFIAEKRQAALTRSIWFLALVLILYCLLLADSRGGMAVGCGVLIMSALLIPKGSQRHWWIYLGSFGFSVTVFLAWEPLLSGTRLFDSTGPNTSSAQRAVLLEQGLRQIVENPLLGIGLGMGSGVMVPVYIAASGGLAFFAAYYFFIFWPLIKMFSLRDSQLIRACIISIFGLLGLGFLNNSFAERFNFWPLAIGFGLVLLSERRARNARR